VPASRASADDSTETLRLLAAAAGGDAAALSALMQRHHGWLMSFAAARLDRRIRSRADASDVVQETQAEVCARLDEFLERRPASFRAWMLKTAYDRLGKLKRRHIVADRRSVLHEAPLDDRSSLQLAEQLVAPHEGPWQRLTREELAQRVQLALGRLSEQDREVLLLRHVEGLDNQEIGYLLDLSVKTVSKRHGRALRHLHAELSSGGVDEDDL
jgi:RNA polymerase sigma-70 factor (ECF subfamily)